MKKTNLFKRMKLLSLSVFWIVLLNSGCATTQKEVPEEPIPPDNFIGLVRLVDHLSDDKFPEACPEGWLVAYSTKKGKNFDVFYFDPFRKKINVVQATRHISDDTDPGWGANCAELFFTSSRLDTLSIWRVKAAGGRGVNQITVREDANDFNPNVSPDGEKIVFTSYKKGKNKESIFARYQNKEEKDPTLWVSNVDGTQMTQIGSGNNPKWSPDGKRIIFHALTGDNYDIWMINPDGTELTQITTDSAEDMDASWSADGTKIVFTSDREGTIKVEPNFDIWALDLAGPGISQLTFDPSDDGAAFWSVDGYVYFHSNRKESYDIYRGKPIIPWEK